MGMIILEHISVGWSSGPRQIPRFVTLRSPKINLRCGPGPEYPVKWILRRQGLPVKVIAEYDTWRQIECHDKTTGWVHQSLLSSARTLLVQKKVIKLLSSPDRDAYPLAKIAEGVLMTFNGKKCSSQRCFVSVQGKKGWVSKNEVWGLLPKE